MGRLRKLIRRFSGGDDVQALIDQAAELCERGQLEQAEQSARRALAAAEHQDDGQLAAALSMLAAVLMRRGEGAEAERLCAASVRLCDRFAWYDASHLYVALTVALNVQLANGSLRAAQLTLDRLVALRLPPAEAVAMRLKLASVCRDLGLFDAARIHIDDALALCAAHAIPTAEAINLKGVVELSRGEPGKALQLFRQLVSLPEPGAETYRSPAHHRDADPVVLSNTAYALLKVGNLEAARYASDEALAAMRQDQALGEPMRAILGFHRAEIEATAGNLDEALTLHQDALSAFERQGAPRDRIARSLVALAQLHRRRGNPQQCRELAERALELVDNQLFSSHPTIRAARALLAELQAEHRSR